MRSVVSFRRSVPRYPLLATRYSLPRYFAFSASNFALMRLYSSSPMHSLAYLHHSTQPRFIFGLFTLWRHPGQVRAMSSFQNSISVPQLRQLAVKISSGFQVCLDCPGHFFSIISNSLNPQARGRVSVEIVVC